MMSMLLASLNGLSIVNIFSCYHWFGWLSRPWEFPPNPTTFSVRLHDVLNNYVDYFSGWRGKPLDMSSPNSSKEVCVRLVKRWQLASQVGQDKTSQVKDPVVGRQRLVIEDEDNEDNGLIIRVRPKGESLKSIRNIDSDISSKNRGDVGPAEDLLSTGCLGAL